MSITDEQQSMLCAELPRDLVKQHPYTGYDYIRGCDAIEQANLIFGFDGWSYKTHDISRAGEVHKDHKANYHVSYLAMCTVTALGCSRTDVGFGVGIKTDPIEAAKDASKAAATDALKRALRSFGNQFGNSLYSHGDETASQPAAPRHIQGGADQSAGGPLVNPDQARPQKRCQQCGNPFTPPPGEEWKTFCSSRCFALNKDRDGRSLPNPTGSQGRETFQTINPDEIPF